METSNIQKSDMDMGAVGARTKNRGVAQVDIKAMVGEQKKSVALVHERTIPTECPPIIGEVSTNFFKIEDATWSAQRIPTTVYSVF
jgi:hypothetical protein